MNQHFVINPFSEEWFLWNSATLFFIILVIFVSRNAHPNFRPKIANLLVLTIFFEILFIQFYYYYAGIWTVQDSLPFHLCRLMWLVSSFAIMFRNQIAFELLLFVGMIGGFHSLMTPEFTHGKDLVLMFDYYLVHGGLIVVPLYCLFVLGMKPRRKAWYTSILYLQILVLGVGCIDYLLGANYMYLASKPIVSNPFLIGDWPFYIIGLELATLLHAFIVYLPFRFKNYFLNPIR